MSENEQREMKVDYGEGMRRMGLSPDAGFVFSTVEQLLDTEDFERFNDSFMSTRAKMIESLVDYRPAEVKRRTLSAMIAYDNTKRLMDELMSQKRRIEMELLAEEGEGDEAES